MLLPAAYEHSELFQRNNAEGILLLVEQFLFIFWLILKERATKT